MKLDKIEFDPSRQSSLSRVTWKKQSLNIDSTKITRTKLDRCEARVDNFSELRSTWHLGSRQEIITDMTASGEFVYVSGIKPITVTRVHPDTNESIEIDVADLFQSAWRAYYPRLRLVRVPDQPGCVLLHEETGNHLFKIDFDHLQIYSPERSVIFRGESLIGQAKKAIGKYFADQNSLHKVIQLNSKLIASYQTGSNQISLHDLLGGVEAELSFGVGDDAKMRVSQVAPLSLTSALVSYYDAAKWTKSDDVRPKDLHHLMVVFPESFNNANDFRPRFELFSLAENILGNKKNK